MLGLLILAYNLDGHLTIGPMFIWNKFSNRNSFNRVVKVFFLMTAIWLVGIDISLAQETPFPLRQISLKEGLSQTSVTAIHQDSLGFLWFGTEDGLNRYDGYSFKTYRYIPGDTTSLRGNTIFAIAASSGTVLWIAGNMGLNRFDMRTKTFQRISLKVDLYIYCLAFDQTGFLWIGAREGLFRLNIVTQSIKKYNDTWTYSLLVDNSGQIWAGQKNSGVIRYDSQLDLFVLQKSKNMAIDTLSVMSLNEDLYGNIYAATNQGVYHKSESNAYFGLYIPSTNLLQILKDNSGRIWISSEDFVLQIFDESSPQKVIFEFKHNPCDSYTIGPHPVASIFEDRSGIIWIGTYGGIYVFDPNLSEFRHIFHHKCGTMGTSNKKVRAVFEDENGAVWIGTNFLYKYDPSLDTLINYSNNPNDPISSQVLRVWAIQSDSKHNLWVGTVDGLYKFDVEKGKFDEDFQNSNLFQTLRKDLRFVTNIYEDDNGLLWISLAEGILIWDLNLDEGWEYRTSSAFLGKENVSSRSLTKDLDGSMWVGTANSGLAHLKLRNNDLCQPDFKFYHFNSKDSINLDNPYVTSLCILDSGIWFGTHSGGLNFFERNTKRFSRILESDGLANNTIYAVVSDNEGNLWLSSNKGLSKFNPKEKTIVNYDMFDGLQSNEFNSGVSFKSQKGELYFGGINGITVFHPDSIKSNAYIPPNILLDIIAGNGSKSVRSYTENGLTVPYAKAIEIPFKERYLSFEFASLNFTNSGKNQYRYRLRGFDEDWINSGSRRFATYTNLDPGNYTFLVQGSNNAGIWNNTGSSISIKILAPFYLTSYAYLAYFLISISLVWLILSESRNRFKLKRTEELNRSKSDFFSNIAHEFRTPLSLILGPVEKLMLDVKDRSVLNLLKPIREQATRLNHLINQLLDIAKLDSELSKLNLHQGDILRFVRDILKQFQIAAHQKQIQLEFISKEEKLIVEFDPDIIQKVLFNLLSNALKFTASQGIISVSFFLEKIENSNDTDSKYFLKILIRDTGMGIPEEHLPFIFDRFYQAKIINTGGGHSTGIGLALCKQLVGLHKGSIRVQSVEGEGTEFTIQIPLSGLVLRNPNKADSETTLPDSKLPKPELLIDLPRQVPTVNRVGDQIQEKILIVEDNAELRKFIKEILDPVYLVLQASDAEEGWEKIIDEIPDLIISDIMMPGIDGIQLCKNVKSNLATNHIPVVLLTAKRNPDTKIKSLNMGADDYIEKPFHPNELSARVNNLLEIRKDLKGKYQKEFVLTPDKIEISTTEHSFLSRVKDIITENIGNANFGVEQLSEKLHMNRQTLHRKLNTITGISPSSWIRSIRMKRAWELLQHSEKSVKEVCYEVGFKEASHFTASFKKFFGLTPKEVKMGGNDLNISG